MRNEKLQPYKKLIEFIGCVLGPDYEIVLQDVSGKSPSIVAIVNNHISGRTIGSPVSGLALNLIRDKVYLHSDYQVNYNSLTKDNQIIRSSTFFIKDKGELIGMLCINFDSSRYLHLSKEILRLCHPDKTVEENYDFTPENKSLKVLETFNDSISELIDIVFENTFRGKDLLIGELPRKERILFLEALNKKGVFQIKGSVSEVASKLCCSEVSIYRYLRKVGKDAEQEGNRPSERE